MYTEHYRSRLAVQLHITDMTYTSQRNGSSMGHSGRK